MKAENKGGNRELITGGKDGHGLKKTEISHSNEKASRAVTEFLHWQSTTAF